MIAAEGLSRRFANRLAVDDVSFEVGNGEIVALLGPNGAGKTTTMRMLAGLIAPTSGLVRVDAAPLNRRTGSALRGRIGFLTEAPGLWDRLTVEENLRVYAELHGLPNAGRRIMAALEAFALADRARERAAELSKGTKQKVALARTLLHEPTVLLLDEPTSGLDPEVTRSVRTLLDERRAAGCSILVSTHNLDEAERIADRVAVLHGRLLAVDRPASLRRRLATGRVIVRVAGDPHAAAASARPYSADADVTVEAGTLVVRVNDADRDTPTLVSALVAGGSAIVEVRHEVPALEDVYLHLLGRDRRQRGDRRHAPGNQEVRQQPATTERRGRGERRERLDVR